MIHSLLAEFHLPQPSVGIAGCLLNGLPEQLRRHEVRAGAGDQVPSVLYEQESLPVDLAVSGDCRLHRASRFGKGRRIQNDHIILLPFLPLGRQEIKDIADHIINAVLEPIEACILLCLTDGEPRGVDGGYVSCSCRRRIQAKRAGVGEAVQHFAPPADRPDGTPVPFLIQEKARFLSVLHVYDVVHAVLRDRHVGVKRLGQKAAPALHSLLLPDPGVASFIDPADSDAVFLQDLHQRRQQQVLPPLDAQGQRFHHQDILIFVHGEPRQKIRFAEDYTAGGRVCHTLPVIPRGPYPLLQKGRRNDVLPFPGQHPDPDGRMRVDEAVAKEIPVEILHAEDVAVLI